MKTKTVSLIAGLVMFVTSALAADFIEIKGPSDLENIRIPLKSGSAYHSQLQELPNGKTPTGFYVGYALKADVVKKGIEGSLTGNLLRGFIDFGTKGEGEKLSPVLNNFEKKFSLKKPGKQWTKVTVDKDTIYEIRWISE